MTYANTTQSDLECGPVAIRALNSLSRRHVDAVTAVTGRGWTVQTLDGYEGYLSIIVEPNEQAANEPSYLISGTIQEIELEEFCNEALTVILRTADIADVTDELSRRLHA